MKLSKIVAPAAIASLLLITGCTTHSNGMSFSFFERTVEFSSGTTIPLSEITRPAKFEHDPGLVFVQGRAIAEVIQESCMDAVPKEDRYKINEVVASADKTLNESYDLDSNPTMASDIKLMDEVLLEHYREVIEDDGCEALTDGFV